MCFPWMWGNVNCHSHNDAEWSDLSRASNIAHVPHICDPSRSQPWVSLSCANSRSAPAPSPSRTISIAGAVNLRLLHRDAWAVRAPAHHPWLTSADDSWVKNRGRRQQLKTSVGVKIGLDVFLLVSQRQFTKSWCHLRKAIKAWRGLIVHQDAQRTVATCLDRFRLKRVQQRRKTSL